MNTNYAKLEFEFDKPIPGTIIDGRCGSIVDTTTGEILVDFIRFEDGEFYAAKESDPDNGFFGSKSEHIAHWSN